MSGSITRSSRLGGGILAPEYDRIARRIGTRLREVYGRPEAEPLPSEHVDLLLRLRQKERDQLRTRGA